MTEILATNIIPSSRIYGDLWGGGWKVWGNPVWSLKKYWKVTPHDLQYSLFSLYRIEYFIKICMFAIKLEPNARHVCDDQNFLFFKKTEFDFSAIFEIYLFFFGL